MTPSDDKPDAHNWSVAPATVTLIVRLLYLACVISVLLDLVIHRHETLSFAESFGFYGFYGLGACVVLVLAATQLRRVLMRDENYYDQEDS